VFLTRRARDGTARDASAARVARAMRHAGTTRSVSLGSAGALCYPQAPVEEAFLSPNGEGHDFSQNLEAHR
jgi:hypothetical protein